MADDVDEELASLRERVARLERLLVELALGSLLLSNAVSEAASVVPEQHVNRLIHMAGVKPPSIANALQTSAEAFDQAKKVYEELHPHGR